MTQEKPVWIWINEDEIPLEAAAIMNKMDQTMIACAVADLWHRTRGTAIEDESVKDAIARFFPVSGLNGRLLQVIPCEPVPHNSRTNRRRGAY